MDRNTKNGAATPQVMVSVEDAKMVETVHKILNHGDDAEVRLTKDGGYKVLQVSKTVIDK